MPRAGQHGDSLEGRRELPPLNLSPELPGSCLVRLDFSFSPSVPLDREHCVPRGHLAMSGDKSGCHNLGDTTGIWRTRPRDAAKHPTVSRMPRNREWPTPLAVVPRLRITLRPSHVCRPRVSPWGSARSPAGMGRYPWGFCTLCLHTLVTAPFSCAPPVVLI